MKPLASTLRMSHTAGSTDDVARKAFPKLPREGILEMVQYRS